MKIYEGVLDENKVSGEVKRAMKSYYTQRDRCYNPNNKRYKNNGAKGIEVKYTSREFIGWWLEEIEKRPKWECATVGRINHDGHYEFGNIRLEERTENSKEVYERLGDWSRQKKSVQVLKNGKLIKITKSLREAAFFIGADVSDASKVARGTRKSCKGFELKYEE